MFFLVIAPDRPGLLEQRLAHRQAHLDYWTGLPGVVKVAGANLTDDQPTATPKGSIFILEADSLESVRTLVDADPFTQSGVFGEDVRIEVMRPAIGDWFPG